MVWNEVVSLFITIFSVMIAFIGGIIGVLNYNKSHKKTDLSVAEMNGRMIGKIDELSRIVSDLKKVYENLNQVVTDYAQSIRLIEKEITTLSENLHKLEKRLEKLEKT